jgi:hypothetical protein
MQEISYSLIQEIAWVESAMDKCAYDHNTHYILKNLKKLYDLHQGTGAVAYRHHKHNVCSPWTYLECKKIEVAMVCNNIFNF